MRRSACHVSGLPARLGCVFESRQSTTGMYVPHALYQPVSEVPLEPVGVSVGSSTSSTRCASFLSSEPDVRCVDMTVTFWLSCLRISWTRTAPWRRFASS